MNQSEADQVQTQRMQSAIQDTPTVRLGQRLRQARLSRNLTQSEVAANQFSVSYISAVERGQIRPSLGALEKLSKRLGVPASDLLRVDEGIAAGVAPRAEFFPTERDEVEVQLRDAMLLRQQGHADQAVRVLRQARSQTGQSLSQREQALINWRMAQAYLDLQNADQARNEAQDALAVAERLSDPELRERIRLTLGEALAMGGKLQAAVDAFNAALEAVETGALRDPVFRLSALYFLGSAQEQLGDVEGAITTLNEATKLATDVLMPERLGQLYARLAEQYQEQNDSRRARLYATHSLAAYEDADNRRLARQTIVRLGRAYAQTGEISQATTLLENARERAEIAQDPGALSEALGALAGIYLKEKRLADAQKAAARAIEYAKVVADPVQQAEAELVLAQVLEAKNDEGGAMRNFEGAIDQLKAVDAVYALSDAYAQYSAFLERRGNNKRALEILKQAWQLRERSMATH